MRSPQPLAQHVLGDLEQLDRGSDALQWYIIAGSTGHAVTIAWSIRPRSVSVVVNDEQAMQDSISDAPARDATTRPVCRGTLGRCADGLVGEQRFGSRDWFVSKLDGRGALEWSKQWGTRGWDTASAVVAPGGGRVWVVGQMAGDPGRGRHRQRPQGQDPRGQLGAVSRWPLRGESPRSDSGRPGRASTCSGVRRVITGA
jgi:hypothetical protein